MSVLNLIIAPRFWYNRGASHIPRLHQNLREIKHHRQSVSQTKYLR